MRDHLRFAVCWWHTLCWPGTDPFGGETFGRPWHGAGDPMAQARAKVDVAFETFRLLGVPFFTFHDRDIAPEGATLRESNRNVSEIAELIGERMAETGMRLLWGTASLFTHRRYMAGAATNPDPEVFAYAAAQVKNVLDLTHELGGANYVLWGGREGYETLLNTDIKRELNQLGRFLTMVVEHKHKIGFKGTILIEPKPKEPTKHQYDFDVASIFGMLKQFGLENEVKDQRRAEPRDPRRPHVRARDCAGLGARHPRLDRHQPRRLPVGLGHRPVRDEHPGARARALRAPAAPAGSRRAASTSTPRSAASRSTRTTSCTRTSARWTPARAACSWPRR